VALSDIQYGASIFSLDLGMIGRKIEENPWIALAEVSRVFPSEVLIRVSEREPVAIINLDYLYYVDREGVVFKVLSSGDSLDFPVITGVTRDEVVDASGVPASLRDALMLLEAMEKSTSFSLDKVAEIHSDPREGITVVTAERGVPVRFGKDGLFLKLNNLERIYAEIEQHLHGLTYIDLNVSDRVIVGRSGGQGMLQG